MPKYLFDSWLREAIYESFDDIITNGIFSNSATTNSSPVIHSFTIKVRENISKSQMQTTAKPSLLPKSYWLQI